MEVEGGGTGEGEEDDEKGAGKEGKGEGGVRRSKMTRREAWKGFPTVKTLSFVANNWFGREERRLYARLRVFRCLVTGVVRKGRGRGGRG